MKVIFSEYETMTGKFEYAMNKENLPRTYKSIKQAEKAIDKIDDVVNFPTKIINSTSEKAFFIVKNIELIKYLKENEERFSEYNNFMNYLNNK